MDFPRRLDVLDFDTPDEELPGYEPPTAPSYDIEVQEMPLIKYHLRAVDRRVQIFVCYENPAAFSYKVISNNFRLFTKKPEMEVARSMAGSGIEKGVASISFDNSGPLPWRPRAHISHNDSHGGSTHAMEAKNFSDWTVVIGGNAYTWTIEGRPISLVLRGANANVVMAKFTYSTYGTAAANGAEVGELSIYGDELSRTCDGIEKTICGLMVAIVHFKKMGRQYCNGEVTRVGSRNRASPPLHRSSVISWATM